LIRSTQFIKIIFIGTVAFLLYYQLTEGEGIDAIKKVFSGKPANISYNFLFITVLLMPINWWLEAVKWQRLMSPHQSLTIGISIKTVVAGIAAGIVTPARIGEYAGRLITSEPDKKTQVISATLLGSIAQNLCNIIGGLGFSYFFLKSVFHVTYDDSLSFIAIITVQIILLVLLFYNLPKVAHYIENKIGLKYFSKYGSKLKSLDLYNNSLLNTVLALSAIRYVVYFLQYICIMKFLGVENTISELGGNIAGIYLIQTGIPLPAFLSIFARGEIAVIVWSALGIHKVTALAATFGLWFINLIIPAIAGIYVLYKTDLNSYLNK